MRRGATASPESKPKKTALVEGVKRRNKSQEKRKTQRTSLERVRSRATPIREAVGPNEGQKKKNRVGETFGREGKTSLKGGGVQG